MKQEDITKYSLGSGALLFAFLISISGFKNGKPTCDNYVINVYLYLALSLIILGALSTYIPWEKTMISPLLLFVLSLVFIIMISLQGNFQNNMTQVISSHIFWVLFILSISGTFWIYLKLPVYQDYINSTILIVSLIFIFMSMLVYINPEFFINTYGRAMAGLMVTLLIIIVLEIYYIFFTKNYAFSNTHRIVSYVVVLVFSLLVSYDTARIFMLADKCNNYPNYPKSSISFFLDVVNLFVRIINLRSR